MGLLKQAAKHPEIGICGMASWGEQLPNLKIKFRSIKRKDKWGLPLIDIDCEFKENEKAMRQDMMNSAAEILKALA